MFVGQYFNWPTTDDEWIQFWEDAELVTEEMLPPYMAYGETDGERKSFMRDNRYCDSTSWAYLSAEEQLRYFAELLDEYVEGCEESDDGWTQRVGIWIDSDDGDGSIHHIYVSRPDSVEPDSEDTDDE